MLYVAQTHNKMFNTISKVLMKIHPETCTFYPVISGIKLLKMPLY